MGAKLLNKKRKNLDKDQKVDVEGVSLYLGKGFVRIISVYQRIRPFRDVVCVLFEQLAVAGAIEQAGKLVVDGVVVNVGAVDERDGFLGIDERLVVAGDDFGDRNLMTAI